MQSAKSIPLLFSEISIIFLSWGSLKDHLSDQNANRTQREVSGDGVASTRQGDCLEAIQKTDGGHLVADQVAVDRQWALILVAGGDEAYNRWDTLEETVKNKEEVEQVWQAFEKSFEQSSLFWHFRDAYLGDVRQDDTETTADLDLRIKQIVRGCQWQKETEEQRMIDLLYHATTYYEIRKYIQEANPETLRYEAIVEKAKAHERNCLEYKDHQASHGGANSAPSYNNPLLSAHAINKCRPSGQNQSHQCGKCGKSHERGNCPAYGRTCNKCKGPNYF